MHLQNINVLISQYARSALPLGAAKNVPIGMNKTPLRDILI
jgi:hypothetical protein